ncbi:hypothetical protein BD770DRAFT_403879, partial [Pilaira anomala]
QFSSSSSGKDGYVRDNHLNGLIRDAVKASPIKFNFDARGLLQEGNKEAYDGILEVLCRTDYFKSKMCDTNGTFSRIRTLFKLICREVYYGLKKKERLIAAENAVKSFKARKTRKFTKRKEIFSSCTDTVTNRMQKSAEECRSFLMKDCMSDEENDTIDPNTGDAISFK